MAVAAATDSNERSHRGDEVCCIAQASRSASPRSRAKSCQRAEGLRGTDRPRPLRKLGSLSAPRFCGDILEPMPRRLTSVSPAHPKGHAEELTWLVAGQ